MQSTATALEIAQNLGATHACTMQIASLDEGMRDAGVRRITTTIREASADAIRTAAAARGFTATFTKEEPGWTRVELVRRGH